MKFFEKKKLILLQFYYLVLDAKLLINHIDFFFFNKPIDTKKLSKLFTAVDVINW